jgi:CubicO group peptidase (beta-lactamase class C family)
MKTLEAQIEALRVKHDLPALVGAIATSQGIQQQVCVGDRQYGSGIKASLSDQFHLGSCTKAMTATLIGRLVEQGKLQWDSSLEILLPNLGDRLHPKYRSVTIHQLLTHTAGCPHTELPNLSVADLHELSGSPREQRWAYITAALEQEPEGYIGEFNYSNLGYAIVGAIAEQVMNQPWEALMQTQIFQPLGMTMAGFGAMGTAGKVDQPLQHLGFGEQRQIVEPGALADNPDAIAPAGKVHCAIGDWGKFIALHLQGYQGTSQLLKPETIQFLHQPSPQGNYAAGWMLMQRDWGNGIVLYHNGSNTMNYAIVWVAPRKDFALLAMTNQGVDNTGQLTVVNMALDEVVVNLLPEVQI